MCITIGLAIPLGKFLLKINGATNRVPVNYLPRRNLYGNSEINSTCSLYCRRVTGELKGVGIAWRLRVEWTLQSFGVYITFFEELTFSLSLPCPLHLSAFIFCSVALLNFLLFLHSYYSLLSYFFSLPFAFFPRSRVQHTGPVSPHDVRCSTVGGTAKP